MNTRPRIKICCISNWHEAQLAIQYGASALGLVGHMPSGPGVIPDEQILTLTQATPPGVSSFLLTSETEAEGIEAHYRRTHPSTIQIVDSVSVATYQSLRQRLPGVKLVQVVHVVGESSVEQSLRVASEVDAILLDSGNPYAAVKELGGTGRTHDWGISRQIVEQVGVPVFLA
ncbi:MAG: phosphoribosylanthranilate isomerase, partial [Bacteroidota bacterium]